MILRGRAHTCTLTEDRVSVEASDLLEGGFNCREDESVGAELRAEQQTSVVLFGL